MNKLFYFLVVMGFALLQAHNGPYRDKYLKKTPISR